MRTARRGVEPQRLDPELRARRAIDHLRAGRLDEAAADFRASIADRPHAPALRNDFGIVLSLLGRSDEAETCYREAIRLDPTHAEAHNNLGNVLHSWGRPVEAEACYREALRLRPQYVDAVVNLARILLTGGPSVEGLALLDRALRQQPANGEVWHILGDALTRDGRFEAGLICLDQAARLRPDQADLHEKRGQALDALGRFAEMGHAYAEAIRLRPEEARLHVGLGTARHHEGRLDEALRAWQTALRLDPSDPSNYDRIGNILMVLGRHGEARLAFGAAAIGHQNAVARQPNDIVALDRLGATLAHLGRHVEAAEVSQRIVERASNSAAAHRNLGVAHAHMGLLDTAVINFTHALELDPGDAEAHLGRAIVRLTLGDLARGGPELEWRSERRNFAARLAATPAWTGGPINGATVLLVADGVPGEAILLARYAALLQAWGGRVVMAAPAPLLPLLGRVAGVAATWDGVGLPPMHDIHAFLPSLPALCGHTLATIPATVPYIRADLDRSKNWGGAGGEALRVGIAWGGDADTEETCPRSTSPRHFAPLAAVPGVHLVGLRPGGNVATSGSGDLPGLEVLDAGFGRGGEAILDATAVLVGLDLLVTSDPLLAHLAGALAVPAWLVLPPRADWCWLVCRDDSPWYPTLRLFRQAGADGWPSVFDQIAAALAAAARGEPGGPLRAAPATAGGLLERVAAMELGH